MSGSGVSLFAGEGVFCGAQGFRLLAAIVPELIVDDSLDGVVQTAAESARRLAGADTVEVCPIRELGEVERRSPDTLVLTIWASGRAYAHVLLERSGRPFDDDERRLAEFGVAMTSLALASSGKPEEDPDLAPSSETLLGRLGSSPPDLAAAAAASAGASEAVLVRYLEDTNELELVAAVGRSEESAHAWHRGTLDDNSLVAAAVRTQRPAFDGELLPGDSTGGSAVALPLSSAGRCLGALGLRYAEEREIGEPDLRRIAFVAQLTAQEFDRRERDLLHDLTRRLQEVTATLAAAHSPAEIVDAILVHGVGALGADAGAVALVDDDRRELKTVSRGFPPELAHILDPMPLSASFPLAEAARTGEMVVLESPADVDAAYPTLLEKRGHPAEYASVSLPIAAGDLPMGAVGFDFLGSRVFHRDERAFLLALSRLCGQALDRANRARLYDRTARLQAVTAGLTQAVTPADVARVVVDVGMAALGADAARMSIFEDGSRALTTIATSGLTPDHIDRLLRIRVDDPMPIAVAASTGEPVLIESVDAAREKWPVAAEAFDGMGFRAIATLPLHGRETILGAIGFAWTDDRSYQEEEKSFLGALAGVCAQALERARLFETLERSRDGLRHLLEHLGEGVVAVDPQLVVAYANEEAARILDHAQLAGAELPDPWPELGLRDLARSVMRSDAAPREEKVTLADGRTLVVVGVPGGGLTTLVFRNVSHRERLERAEREFLANAAHELRTPLTAIAAAVDALERGAKEHSSERDFYLAGLGGEVDRLTRLSQALLLLARARSDPELLLCSRVDVGALVTDVATRLEVKPGVRVLVKGEAGAARGDRALLDAALTNIARNASRHTSSGTITLSSLTGPDGSVVIEVADTGDGMSPEVRERATERFYRGVDRDRNGFGLGLPLASEMVEALGGRLEITSRLGAGTVVRISLPGA